MYPICSVDEDHTQRIWAGPQQLSETRGQQRVTLSPGLEVLVHCMGQIFYLFPLDCGAGYICNERGCLKPPYPEIVNNSKVKSNYSVFTSYVLVHM